MTQQNGYSLGSLVNFIDFGIELSCKAVYIPLR